MLDEAERSLHDALCVLSQTVRDSRVLYGGGWAEVQVRHSVTQQYQFARCRSLFPSEKAQVASRGRLLCSSGWVTVGTRRAAKMF